MPVSDPDTGNQSSKHVRKNKSLSRRVCQARRGPAASPRRESLLVFAASPEAAAAYSTGQRQQLDAAFSTGEQAATVEVDFFR